MIPKELCGLEEKTQEKLISLFKNHPKIERVILFGSRAKGTFKVGSDIDLAIVAPAFTTRDLLKVENEIDDLMLPYKVDSVLYQLVDNAQLVEHIDRVGKALYLSKSGD